MNALTQVFAHEAQNWEINPVDNVPLEDKIKRCLNSHSSWFHVTPFSQLLYSWWRPRSDVHCQDSEDQKCQYPQETNQSGEGPPLLRTHWCIRSMPLFPIDNLHSKSPPTVGPKLRMENLLSDMFPSELDINRIHIVQHVFWAKVSIMSTLLWFCSLFCRGAPSPSSGPPPSAYKFPVLSTDQTGQDREKFCRWRKSEAPSTSGKADFSQ